MKFIVEPMPEMIEIEAVEAEEEPYTCDCGEPLDATLPVSMCRACFDSCVPANGDES